MEKQSDKINEWICEIALSDSQSAFKSLYLAYFQRLTRFISLYVSSPVEVEEIISDTFLALWNNRKSLPEVGNFNSYIYSVARNKAISQYRTQHMEKVDMDENMIDLFAHTDTTPEKELISKECVDLLNQAINTLPDKCKIAFKLIREDKMKYKDAANILQISVKTLEAHIATAVRKLREVLSKDITG